MGSTLSVSVLSPATGVMDLDQPSTLLLRAAYSFGDTPTTHVYSIGFFDQRDYAAGKTSGALWQQSIAAGATKGVVSCKVTAQSTVFAGRSYVFCLFSPPLALFGAFGAQGTFNATSAVISVTSEDYRANCRKTAAEGELDTARKVMRSLEVQLLDQKKKVKELENKVRKMHGLPINDDESDDDEEQAQAAGREAPVLIQVMPQQKYKKRKSGA